ncbi:hypothetical protein EDB92DRAFT_1817101 [Lactarius akahatsu]|uniref:Uncharacterized protein n=1 Tax=Lactarius akahatsu TaxID=416441 RepID=A0AAD4QCS4_9AGAM|nr:hypothetical protein EDB92DRAFT_1817101 [Lactarius akahatsu]
MPALIPVHNIIGALFIGTVLSSMLVDTVNLVFCIYTSYQFGVTNFGDYRSNQFDPWSQAVRLLYHGVHPETYKFLNAITLSAIALAISVEQYVCHGSSFYAYRVYCLGGGSPYLPAAIVRPRNLFGAGTHSHEQSVTSLTEFGIILVFSVQFKSVPCDVLITVGMVYYLLSNRTQVRRLSATVTITLVLFTFTPCVLWSNIDPLNEVRQVSRYTHIYPDLLHYVSSLSLCIHGHPELTRLPPLGARRTGRCRCYVHLAQGTHGTTVPWGAQGMTEASANTAVPKSLPPAFVSSNTPFSDGVIAFDREKYPVPPAIRLGSS